ncbi:leucyl/phenylalanyl-tRNA--protein transferase [Thalassotalea psychrophila]|uniref:Leucyl/phenylalanyl-tRNA--protein transferase n=1 Tax=Thalassotalea psychrophila TaxID=3065647 RepID=A0ABY9TP06_9GAMM|nr:leucyl/phenylalanyl-tRNA--protein transferase [Colwelliaceae bacterium SQ149]
MSQYLYTLDDKELAFPPHQFALNEPNGLIAMGGDLSPQRLIQAYTNGIFPWFNDGDPILWWSPDPRAIIKVADLKVNRTLKKFINKSSYKVTLNTCFNQVIDICADAPFRSDDTWILPDMLNSYKQLHHQGIAHSIEVWHEDKLVGGLYGVAINGFFSGESMFYTKTNASKIALVALINLLNSIGVEFIDCQIQNPFLESMGAIEITRDEFLHLKSNELKKAITNGFWLKRELTI